MKGIEDENLIEVQKFLKFFSRYGLDAYIDKFGKEEFLKKYDKLIKSVLEYNTFADVETQFKDLTFPKLYKEYLASIKNKKILMEICQELHNRFAKKLKIAPVKLEANKNSHTEKGSFINTDIKRKEQDNTRIIMGKALDKYILAVLHETKHSHQMYMLFNLIAKNCEIKDDYSKLVCAFLLCYKLDSNNVHNLDKWYKKITEIDAEIYSQQQLSVLKNKYAEFNNQEVNNKIDLIKLRLIIRLKYNHEGLNNKILSQIRKCLIKDLIDMCDGMYGQYVQQISLKIIGLNNKPIVLGGEINPVSKKSVISLTTKLVDKGLERLVKQLDAIQEEITCKYSLTF